MRLRFNALISLYVCFLNKWYLILNKIAKESHLFEIEKEKKKTTSKTLLSCLIKSSNQDNAVDLSRKAKRCILKTT